jgi:geranylgeranyl pyrophosphate synthase/predicted secreted hydrolase
MVKYPSDWPADGPIDLTKHDLPHGSSSTEWWYINCHVETASGRKVSLFASFFRIIAERDEETGENIHAHSLTWAMADAGAKTYVGESRVDRKAPRLGLKRIDRGEGASDKRLQRAMKEVLLKDNVPYPDRMFESDVWVSDRKLDLDFAGNRYEKLDDGRYHLVLFDHEQNIGADLFLTPQKPPARHGDNGVVKSVHGEDMFYYFIARNEVTGTVTLKTGEEPASGSGWYDHEFGCHVFDTAALQAPKENPHAAADKPDEDIAWNWISVQFEGGWELTSYSLVDLISGEGRGNYAVVIEPDGSYRSVDDVEFTQQGMWRSTRTFNEYPTQYDLKVPSENIEIAAVPAFADQEFITVISKPAFWEGRVHVTGTRNGEACAGVGFVERSGFVAAKDLDGFFKSVGKEVRKSVAELLPYDPTWEHVRDLIASPDRPQYMRGVDTDKFVQFGVKPVRDITDRGGKSWRSYAALACCDVVGGDSREFVKWLAMPELLHVGSLIVDDVQDKSTWRRGGPTCHEIHGEPTAINAGTACYFMGQKLLQSGQLSSKDRLRLYDLYFEALRAGHAGQAVDIGGLDYMIPDVLETGDTTLLQERVLAIHRLKTAVPAASLARMGAVAGEGTEEQIEGIGLFFESVGLAFQVIDDVLNLRGFKGDLKSKGEDLQQGKITLPVAKALGRLAPGARKSLWEGVASKSQDPAVIADLIQRIEDAGALDECVREANDLVESAWVEMDPLIHDSLPKLMLRAFGWYVLERHY